MAIVQATFSHPKYRPDIDGLRAVAVLSVVVFHAFPEWMRGGFIGVDVFFVISGYLISTIIFENLERGSFRFGEFYARRIKRIFPALILVLLGCLAFGWIALLADEYKQLGRHTAAGAGFISNFVLWSEAGYFDNSAETKPLLHLWSLGIEEQFYIVWPFLLWLAWKRRFSLLGITLAVAGLSFALNAAQVGNNAVATFYSPQTRFWELLCGSLLAWAALYKKDALADAWHRLDAGLAMLMSRKQPAAAGGMAANLLSLLGLLLLATGFWRIDSTLAFPGFWAVMPVLGAALIIAAGPQAWINRTVLANRMAVWFGLISFPLYLWHWPLLSFARIVESGVPDARIRILAVALAIALAWLTYRLVERRVRAGGYQGLKVAVLVVCMVALGCAGYVTDRNEGWPARAALAKGAENSALLKGFGEDDPAAHAACMQTYGLSGRIRYCNLSGTGKPKLALIGDSHAKALYVGMAELLQERNQGVLNVGGRLLLGVATHPPGDQFEIDVYKGGIRATEFAAQEPSIETVVMVSRGPFYMNGAWLFQLIDRPDITDRKKIWELAMRNTLDRFVSAGKQVVFVLDNPELGFDPRSCLDSRPLRISNQVRRPCAVPRSEYDARNKDYRTVVLSVLKDYPGVKLFDAAAYLCDDTWCRAMRDDKILYFDGDHLSRAGSRYLAGELLQVLDGRKSKMLAEQ
jgi:peptidoglycan/LPS O-acetylase OafA/YrhL